MSSLGAIGLSRGASFDIVLTMTITGSLACFFVSETRARLSHNGRRSMNWWHLGFYLFAGLSLLAKGLIGFVIIFGVIGLYFILRREWPRRSFVLSFIWGVSAALLLAGVWYGPMIARHGWLFIDQFIIQHHFARFVSNKFHHPAPFYFYLPVLIGLALPWTIVLGAGLLASRRWNWRGESSLDRARIFALAWLLVPLVFFSFSGSKLAAYILPVLPAVAILVGERIDCFCRQGRGEKVLRLTGALLIVMAAAGTLYTFENSRPSLVTILAAWLLFMVGASVLLRPRPAGRSFIAIAVAVFLSAVVGVKVVGPSVARSQSTRDLLTAAAGRGYSNTPIVQLHTIQRSAEFYAAGRLTYGSDGEPVKFEGAAQVAEAARRAGAVLCLVPIEFESQVINLVGTDSELVSDNSVVALLVVRAR